MAGLCTALGFYIAPPAILFAAVGIALLHDRRYMAALSSEFEDIINDPFLHEELPFAFRHLPKKIKKAANALKMAAPPEIYVIKNYPRFAASSPVPHSAILFSSALFRRVNSDEAEGLSAHELKHLTSGTLTQSRILGVLGSTASVASGLNFIYQAGALLIDILYGCKELKTPAVMTAASFVAAPIVANIARLTIASHSRRVEFRMDREASDVTGRPEAIASALQKIDDEQADFEHHMRYVSGWPNIFWRGIRGLKCIFAEHPNTTRRRKRLLKMAKRSGNKKSLSLV